MNTQGQITVRQWFALPEDERIRRAAAFREADEALQANGDAEQAAGIRDETDEYLRLNGRVNELWPTVPSWIRDPALPHPGSRHRAALYAVTAVAMFVVVVMIALSLSGCSAPCSGHGGLNYVLGGWYHCNDGTIE